MTAQQRRESILAAATEVFAETGYQRGKTSAVANRVGVSEPVIFQNFGTKAALFAAVVTRHADQVCAWLDRLTAQRVSVAGLLAAALDPTHVEHIHDAGTIGALFAEASTLTGEPEIEAAAHRANQRIAGALTNLLEQGRRAGEMRTDLDTESGAWWLLSLAASQKFRRAAAPETIEARLAKTTLEFFIGNEH